MAMLSSRRRSTLWFAIGIYSAFLALPSDGVLASMPIHALTPGDVAERSTSDVCARGDSRRHRSVSYRIRDQIYRAYGIPRGQRQGRYRIDHLIPLELGGSNRASNLWPQPVADSKLKDRIEAELHTAVCGGRMHLDQAQRAIAHDWHTAMPARSQP